MSSRSFARTAEASGLVAWVPSKIVPISTPMREAWTRVPTAGFNLSSIGVVSSSSDSWHPTVLDRG